MINEFHYTKPEMVRDLLNITPITYNDVVLDAGSGNNKVWYNTLDVLEKYECELVDGNDFFKFNKKVDWVVGNPPYHLSWKFTEHAITLTRKGVAWLINNQALNSHLTPKRLDLLKNYGLEYSKIHVVADKRWFGRYYYIILEKKPGVISWHRKTY